MKYEKVILVTPETAEEQAHFESEYPHLQYFAFRTLKTFIVPVGDEDLVKGQNHHADAVNNYPTAVTVLNNYYGIQVPDSVLKATIEKHPAVRSAIESGGIEAAEQRGVLVNALLRELGQPTWPASGTEPREFQNFKINLSVKLAQIGGKLKYQKV